MEDRDQACLHLKSHSRQAAVAMLVGLAAPSPMGEERQRTMAGAGFPASPSSKEAAELEPEHEQRVPVKSSQS